MTFVRSAGVHAAAFGLTALATLPPNGARKHHRPPLPTRRAEGDEAVIREELSRVFTVAERHRRLLARLLLALAASIAVFTAGTILIWVLESGRKGGDIHGLGDSAFFCAVQMLTVSSQIKNPLTSPGKVVDVGLEVWAVFVITVVAGSFATFFSSGDSN